MEIKIEGLKKNHGQRTVLDIAQLHLERAHFYGILGPNGSGKSTLLRLIGGLEKPTSGRITYDGQCLSGPGLKEMTYMGQQHYLLRTTVFENIAYPLKVRKVETRAIEEKVTSMLREMRLENLRDQLATKLSGGESQKVALARALIFEPKLLLLDEPTASIDPDSMALIEAVLKKRHDLKLGTTIMVTHNVQQARDLCDCILAMRDGEIIFIDERENL